MEQTKLHKKFMKGLEKLNISLDEIKNYSYCGGDTSMADKNYYFLCFPEKKENKKFPEKKEKCICGMKIKNNCYIKDEKDKILVVGSCCIKKFIQKSNRTCEDCGAFHKNRKDNKCNDCRKKSKQLKSSCGGCTIISYEDKINPVKKLYKQESYRSIYKIIGEDAFIDSESE